ncbi:MAG TPA: hypothetical protein VKT73_15350 [Xanthobacteraceae bacterium]|nr:hypothetical protein [Xanthobacteraceae bacterium]
MTIPLLGFPFEVLASSGRFYRCAPNGSDTAFVLESREGDYVVYREGSVEFLGKRIVIPESYETIIEVVARLHELGQLPPTPTPPPKERSENGQEA